MQKDKNNHYSSKLKLEIINKVLIDKQGPESNPIDSGFIGNYSDVYLNSVASKLLTPQYKGLFSAFFSIIVVCKIGAFLATSKYKRKFFRC